MHPLILVLSLATAALAAPAVEEEPHPLSGYNYHERFGIKALERIKAFEQAQDFDGSRIYGGSPARLGQYPFMAGTVIVLNNGRQTYCGASLVSPTRLVNAAHCWTDGRLIGRSMTVVLASLTLWSGGTRVPATRIVLHPQYTPMGSRNDIGIIHIARVALSTNINTINLPTSNLPYNGVRANAVGYGQTNNSPNNQSLRHVQVTVMTHADCVRAFGNMASGGGVLCVDTRGGRSPCFGDSGGPLQNPTGNVLIGVASFVSNHNCASGLPAGFARVGFYISWLRQNM